MVFLFLFFFSFFSLASENSVEEALKNMSDGEKIGQMIIVRTYTKEPIEDLLKVFTPGGFIHHGRSNEYLPIIKKIHSLHKISLRKTGFQTLFTVDQEGCGVNRFNNRFSQIGTRRLAAAKDLKLIEEYGFHLGLFLHTIGFNMNLAPVVDVAHKDKKSYMWGRSFSSDPREVQKFSRALTSGLQRAGVAAVFKHFPGYSMSEKDSHRELVTIPLSKRALKKRDFVPYRWGRGLEYPSGVMSNIALYPKLDSEFTAPLSKKIITGILKKELRYKGILMTDDIGMKGYKEKDPIKRAVGAVLAGHDMMLLTKFRNAAVIQIYDGLLKALKAGEIPSRRVDESVRKILTLKANLLRDKRSSEKKVQSLKNYQKRLLEVDSEVTRTMLDVFFKKNRHLEKSIAPDAKIFSFTNDSFDIVESLKFFKNHKRVLWFKEEEKKKIRSLFRDGEGVLGFCYGSRCKNWFKGEEDLRGRILVVDSSCGPSFVDEGRFRAYIPIWGGSQEAARRALLRTLQNPPPSASPSPSS